MSRDRSGRSDVSMGDWRSGPRQDNNADMDRRGFSRDREREGKVETSYTRWALLSLKFMKKKFSFRYFWSVAGRSPVY